MYLSVTNNGKTLITTLANRPLSQREFPALGGDVETDDQESDERNAYRQEQNQPHGILLFYKFK